MATLQEVLDKLNALPDGIKAMEFATFDSVTGTRTMFQTGVSEIRVAYSFGRPLIELQGSQDVAQRESAPTFPGKR